MRPGLTQHRSLYFSLVSDDGPLLELVGSFVAISLPLLAILADGDLPRVAHGDEEVTIAAGEREVWSQPTNTFHKCMKTTADLIHNHISKLYDAITCV